MIIIFNGSTLLNTHLIDRMKLEALRGIIKISYTNELNEEQHELNIRFRNRRNAKLTYDAILLAKEKGCEFLFADDRDISIDEKEHRQYCQHDAARSAYIYSTKIRLFSLPKEDDTKEK